MLFFAAILSFIPLAAFAISRRASEAKSARWQATLRLLALFAVGLMAALPFLTSRGVGTGEAYNYSLAVADAVTQFRAGELPPLAGQTEFAFNGRVHPLRNAPYLFYLAGALDAVTFHQLSFWELQNLSLAFGLIAAVFSCYGALRWGTGCTPPLAMGLAAIYGLSPAVLAAANANLFMTVHAAAFLPVAVGACLRHCRTATPLNDVALAAALAATWLAHPPVALWLTAGLGWVRLMILARNSSWQAWVGLIFSTLLGLALAGFVFASAATLSSELGYFPSGDEVRTGYVNVVWANIRAAFPGALLPASRGANLLSDLQFGYAGWALLVIAIAGRIRVFRKGYGPASVQAASLGLLLFTLLLLVLTLPVPQLTRWLWLHLPTAVHTLTAVWPMQRLYLVAIAFTIFAVALLQAESRRTFKLPGRAIQTIAALCLLWTLFQGAVFVRGGLALRWPEDASQRSHRSSNLDLTVTSYAFLRLPPTFMNGVMDPLFEFRVIKSDGREVDSPLKAALAAAPVVAHGDILLRASPKGPVTEVSPAKLTLQPGRRYLLSFKFLTPPFRGTVEIIGPSLLRAYALPSSGQPQGFGMGEANRHSFSIWTSLAHPEEAVLRISLQEKPAVSDATAKVAEFTLQEVDTALLPVRMDSLLPLRCSVATTEAGCYLVTPRGYLPGYVATVNGRPLRPAVSPDGQIMLPLAQGQNSVELRYVGLPSLRAAFWFSAVTWLGLLVWLAGRAAGVNWSGVFAGPRNFIGRLLTLLWRYKLPVLVLAAASGAVTIFLLRRADYLQSFGPVHLRVVFPTKQTGRQQPLLVTGKTGEGTNVFVSYVDDRHVRIGADIWGTLHQSEPIAVDYFQEQNVVVNSSALYPLDHPRVRALSEDTRQRLRRDFRVEFNGRPVLSGPHFAYESTVAQVTVGETRIGGSLTQPKFTGEVLRVARLPLPRPVVLGGRQPLRLQLRFPENRLGITETLVALGSAGEGGALTVSYLPKNRVLLAHRAKDGTILASGELESSARLNHALTFAFGGSAGSAIPVVKAEGDRKSIFGPEKLEPSDKPHALLVGLARSELPGVEARFTGPELAVEAAPQDPTAKAAESFGALRMLVTLPSDKLSRPEPLLTTGRNGAGDFAYIVYVDAGHVRFGVDHWGVGGALSEPVAIDYHAPHEIEIRQGALYPDESDPAWLGIPLEQRRQRKSEMEIRLNGRSVLKAALPAHPATSAEITVGENRIGGSNCDAVFTGEIHSTQRLNLSE